MHEDQGLGFERLAYIAPGPPPPISAASVSTTVTPFTTTGASLLAARFGEGGSTDSTTSRRVLTRDERRRMCEYHESHPGAKQIEIGGTSPALYPRPILQLTLSSGVWC
jgi:hypothetical protein